MTKLSGIVSLGIGIFIFILVIILKWNNFFIAMFYSLSLIIIGLIIILRKGEDNIEKINYRRLKNNDKK